MILLELRSCRRADHVSAATAGLVTSVMRRQVLKPWQWIKIWEVLYDFAGFSGIFWESKNKMNKSHSHWDSFRSSQPWFLDLAWIARTFPRKIFEGDWNPSGTERLGFSEVGILEHIVTLGHVLPSGKRLHGYGKSPFLLGKLTINGHFQ